MGKMPIYNVPLSLLKTAGNIEQQEILISRIDCWLM
jgi:hypothetical protein